MSMTHYFDDLISDSIWARGNQIFELTCSILELGKSYFGSSVVYVRPYHGGSKYVFWEKASDDQFHAAWRVDFKNFGIPA